MRPLHFEHRTNHFSFIMGLAGSCRTDQCKIQESKVPVKKFITGCKMKQCHTFPPDSLPRAGCLSSDASPIFPRKDLHRKNTPPVDRRRQWPYNQIGESEKGFGASKIRGAAEVGKCLQATQGPRGDEVRAASRQCSVKSSANQCG